MQFIADFLITVLVAYTSVTGAMADRILALLDNANDVGSSIAVEEAAEPGLATLPSVIEKASIPSILRESIAYQSAAVAGSALASSYTTDPLAAIVNIYCTFVTNNTIRTTTGTGFFVHGDGVIMTNAHVAQYLLLETTDVLGEADCLIRQGDPATARYRAELLYIPPAWVQKNAAVIDAAVPMGTGERDYALLYVSESLTEEPLPARFPALAVSTELLANDTKESTVTAAGYPATDLLRNGGKAELRPRQADTTVSELYTFGSNLADVFSIRGSAVGAEGSSGGPILNENDEVIGIIVTRGDDETDGQGSLRAITLSHIDRTITEETGFTLERNLTGDLPLRSTVFMETLAPFLLSILKTEIEN